MPSHALRKEVEKIMQQKKTPTMMSSSKSIMKLPTLIEEDLKSKKNSHNKINNVSPTPTLGAATTRKSSSGRWGCLCSPTTHVGSFRCRRHRGGGSMDSNIFELGSKDSSPHLSNKDAHHQ